MMDTNEPQDAGTARLRARGTLKRRHLLAVALATPAIVQAQSSGPIRLLCPWAPGGTVDSYLRGLAVIASGHLGRDLIIENRAGASGAVGLAWLKNQRPDGTVIAGVTEAAFRVSVVQRVQYDPMKDFDFLAGTYNALSGWGVRTDSPITSLTDLVQRAKATPEGISYAAGGTPDNPPIGMKLLEHRAGIRLLFVPYAGGGAMLTAVLGRNVDVVFDTIGTLAGAVEGREIRLLALAAEERSPRWPDVPTARELGFDAVHTQRLGIIAPRGLPPEVRAPLERGLLQAEADPAHAQLLQRLYLASWRRTGAAFEEEMRVLLAGLPDTLRELGLPMRN